MVEKREEKRRQKEEKGIEMSKVGERSEGGSVSDAAFVRDGEGAGGEEGDGSWVDGNAQAKGSRWWHRS